MNSTAPLQQELLSRADNIFASIAAAVNKTTTFAGEQLPDIAMQYIAYGRVYTTVVMIAAMIGFMISLYLIVCVALLNTRKFKVDVYWGNEQISAFLSGLVLLVISLITGLVTLSSFIMAWFAPKVWLITEITKLLK